MINRLNTEFGMESGVEFLSGPGGLPQVVLENEFASAVISIYGAQVLSYKPTGKDDLLWVSDKSRYERGRAIRGGIPVCWPWFGAHPTDSSMPAHGFARLLEWTVSGVRVADDGSTVITLRLPCSEITRKVWKHEFDALISITLGSKLEVSLTTQNTGLEPFEITAALHSYFSISDIKHILVRGLEGEKFIDMLSDTEGVEQDAVTVDREVDRVYPGHGGDCLIEDPGMSRAIRISKRGSRSTVLWNPWVNKSRRMTDFGDDEYRRMICLETTNSHSDARWISPGESHTLTTIISLD